MRYYMSILYCRIYKWILRKTRYSVSQLSLFGIKVLLRNRTSINYNRYLKVDKFYNSKNIYSKCTDKPVQISNIKIL